VPRLVIGTWSVRCVEHLLQRLARQQGVAANLMTRVRSACRRRRERPLAQVQLDQPMCSAIQLVVPHVCQALRHRGRGARVHRAGPRRVVRDLPRIQLWLRKPTPRPFRWAL